MDRIPACRQAGREVSKTLEMYWIYAIHSDKDGRIYVGFSKDLDLRLKQHNAGKTRPTKGYRSWRFIYSEKVEERTEAREKEKYFKSGIGKEFLKSLPTYLAP